ncbi:T9SS type B sorting domain-containing protein, partial [Psychroserpens sp.]|uniref:T9SS type B sorting domain-containing protein n=1 Tax=Psychroserpens sp. TaxID=2020870 RepID=UPI003C74643A
IPNTTVPVNTNTIHDEIVGFCPASNDTYFEGYNIGDTNYNGRTTVLTATASIVPYVQYTIKLVIADQGDEFYDSAVFIQGNSFGASVDLGPDIITCGDSVTLNGDIQNDQATFQWFQNGTLIPGETNSTLVVTESGTYTVEIDVQLNNTDCEIQDVIIVTLNSEQASGSISDYLLCDDGLNDGIETFTLNSKDAEILGSLPFSNYGVSYHLSSEDAITGDNPLPNSYQNTTSPQEIFVRTLDLNNGCLAFATFNLIVNEAPEINEPSEITICANNATNGATLIDLDPTSQDVTGGNPDQFISYHYTQQDANTGANPLFSPYTTINANDTLFIRVFDATTGCFSTTTVDISVIESPIVNTENQWINACEQDEDGFAEFDLLSVVDNVLQGLTDVTVTFHETLDDAQTGANPIADPENYQNIIPEFQIIYIRIVDDTTGCSIIVELELHANIILNTFSDEEFDVCDDASNDGIADFDLNVIEEELVDGYDGFEVTFYETIENADNATNPLDKTVPFTATSSPTTIYAILLSDDCVETIPITLIINPPIDIQGLGTVDYCDENDDGFTSILLETFNDFVSDGVNNANVKYYLSEEDALADENILPPYYANSVNPLQVWVRVTNSLTSCFDIAPLSINVTGAPTTVFPSDIIICDDNSDGVFNVNLENKIPEIVTNTTNLNFTFYTDYNDAFIGTGEITTPNSYDTTSQFIYVRVENENSGCFTVVYFYAYINTIPEFTTITNFENCEADGNEIADFYFYLKDAEILNGQTGKDVLYFETAQDAIDRVNSIDKFNPYQNTSSPQTIHVRVENVVDIDCFGTSQFDLEVGALPLFNEPADIFACDDLSNDGNATFDLNEQVLEISESIPQTLSISFHPSQYDADQNLNELPLNFSNTSNPQQIYVRIENGTNCTATAEFIINVIQVPEATTPSDLIVCDTDDDGFVSFDLTTVEVEVLDVRQDDIVITYHESFTGVETDTEIIPDPENYTNTSNPQTVYIKINNTVSNCYVSLPINLIVNLPPVINDFETYEICDNTSSSFDLSIIDTIVTNETGHSIIYHNSLSDAENSINPINTNYTYTSSNDTIFVRLENATTGCSTIYNFDLLINPLPIANIPDTFLACDDISNDALESINLTLLDSQVLGTQNPDLFTVSYYNTVGLANEGITNLPDFYEAANGEFIFVRIENNLTGCFAITQFDVIINEYPNSPSALTNCDDDYDAITTFDLTLIEPELFEIDNPNTVLTYFENLNDLENDINSISNPNNYTNLNTPQTIFVKVFNTAANCFQHVSFNIYVNLPPAIHLLNSIDSCATESGTTLLSNLNEQLLIQTANVLVTYYASEADALAQDNALDDVYAYQTNSDTLFARIQFSTTQCYYIHEFSLLINELPIANEPLPLETCDNDFDGIYNFDLSQQNSSILGNQNPNDFSIFYYSNLNDAIQNTNALPINYDAFSFETIFARVENNVTLCYSITQFQTIIREKPEVAIPSQTICLDDLPLLVSANTNRIGDTYQWSTNAITPDIEISEVGIYSVTVTTTFGCETTSVFSVSESEAATIDFTESIDFSDPNNITITISGIGNYLYQLDDGIPQQSNVFQNVSLGYHTVTIIDLNGCAEVTKEVVVIDAPKFMTPNGDGYFDTWHITGVETLPGTIVYIFDRHGKLLISLTHNSQGWNGRYNGHQMPAADYWYLAKVRKGDINFEVKGHFSLRL